MSFLSLPKLTRRTKSGRAKEVSGHAGSAAAITSPRAANASSIPRTYLMVTPHRPADVFPAGETWAAQTVVIDMHSPTVPLKSVRAFLKDRGPHATPQIWVRVHEARTMACESELDALSGLTDGFVLPDVMCEQDLQWVAERVPRAPLLPVLERSDALLRVMSIARHPSVARLGFSSLTASRDLSDGMLSLENAVSWAHRIIVGASAAAHLPGPVAGLHPGLRNNGQLVQEATLAVRTGFTGYCVTAAGHLPHIEALFTDHDAIRRSRTAPPA
ncbi:hypothetical protein [Streptomyces sp. NPDC060022]|uniref:hypothetical protein n=1 Tax=Streptomyces sp. NPDC060022 TaxID=3347039 RepID=UPI0036C1EA28